jgi:DNA-directed RNA polymerase subunit H
MSNRLIPPPIIVINNIYNAFFKYRGLEVANRSFTGPDVVMSDDRIITDMDQFNYVRLDAKRKIPRGKRDWVVILVLSMNGKYANHSPELRKLIEGIEADTLSQEGRLDEVIIVAEENFFAKKNLTDVIKNLQSTQIGGADINGATTFYNAYPYYIFATIIPEHNSVPAHRIMSENEVNELLKSEHINKSDIGTIMVSDPPVIWIGGREDQIVEITRDSATAGTAIYYRYIR